MLCPKRLPDIPHGSATSVSLDVVGVWTAWRILTVRRCAGRMSGLWDGPALQAPERLARSKPCPGMAIQKGCGGTHRWGEQPPFMQSRRELHSHTSHHHRQGHSSIRQRVLTKNETWCSWAPMCRSVQGASQWHPTDGASPGLREIISFAIIGWGSFAEQKAIWSCPENCQIEMTAEYEIIQSSLYPLKFSCLPLLVEGSVPRTKARMFLSRKLSDWDYSEIWDHTESTLSFDKVNASDDRL